VERAADTLSLMVSALGLGPQDLSERGAYFREGGLKTEPMLSIYKCNKVSNNYSMATQRPPLKLSDIQLHFPV